MVRSLILLLLLGPFALLFFVLLVASNYVDQRGLAVNGTIYAKREYVSISYSQWKLSRTVTIEYPLLETGGVYFLQLPVSAERYDSYHKGQTVPLHYLRKRDIPALPMARVLWEMNALPKVRLADQTTTSALQGRFTARFINNLKLAGVSVLVLCIWRFLRIPGFGWGLGICVVSAVILSSLADFPMPVPAPRNSLRQASAHVVADERIEKLFSGAHERGFVASQPVEVVAAEFVPFGKIEPVVAVDLIDAGSLGHLKENQAVLLDYEEQSPRVASLQGATRHFPERNLRGIGVELVLCVVALIACLGISQLIGKGYRRLVGGVKRPV